MRIIGHLDMDAFFAAIEERDNPRLRGKPVVVGADPREGKGRGVVSTANYKAREYGIRSALPISTAWRFSEAARRKGLPEAVFVGVRMEKYAEASARIMAILRAQVPVVEEASRSPLTNTSSPRCEMVLRRARRDKETERLLRRRGATTPCAKPDATLRDMANLSNPVVAPSSEYSRTPQSSLLGLAQIGSYRGRNVFERGGLDEAYFDLSSVGSYEKAKALCIRIKNEIKARENLTCSVGIGPNKLIAKIASDRHKPDGLTVIPEQEAEKFLEPLTIRTIPGVGPKTEAQFHAMGIRTVRDAKRLSRGQLNELMGKWGIALYDRLRAKDDSPLVEEWEAKSVGVQETFEEDTLSLEFLRTRLQELSKDVYERFRSEGFKTFRTVVIIVRFAGFITKTRSSTLKAPSSDRKTLEFEALKLLMPFLDARENPKRQLIRLIGVRVEKLE